MAVSRLPRPAEAWVRLGSIVAAIVMLVVSVSLGASIYDNTLLALFAGALAQTAALPLAVVRPKLAAPLSVAGAVAIVWSTFAATAPWPWAVTTIITQCLVLVFLGYRAPWMLGAGALILAIVASGLVARVVRPGADPDAVAENLVIAASVGAAALITGIVLQGWETIRRQLARERRLTEEERALRLLAEEKTRIARELHDVIAHSMSLITVQATSAPFRHPGTSPALRGEFDDIAAASRRALTEMRSMLGVLRDADLPADRTPQPSLSGIPELVTQARHSGLRVVLTGADALTDEGVDDTIGLTAFRIVQEALSNAIRHAKGADVDVRVTRGENLDILISNGAPPRIRASRSRPRVPDPGHGLTGMRERAASVGGTLAFGSVGEGFQIHATLPLAAPSDPGKPDR